MSALSLSLYRSVLRKASALTANNCKMLLREPMDVRLWGQGRFVKDAPADVLKACFDFELPEPALVALGLNDAKHGVPGDSSETPSDVNDLVPPERVVQAICGSARFYQARCEAGELDEMTVVSNSFSAMRSLASLVENSLQARVTTTNGVQVEVVTKQVGKTAEEYDQNPMHVFCYRVRIKNSARNNKVQLVGRHLIFTDATGSTEEVPRGSAGVVGHTPVLEPGQSFEYYSGIYTPTTTGSMSGSFQMVEMGPSGTERKTFDAIIGPATFRGDDKRIRAEEVEGEPSLDNPGPGDGIV